jgi:hypothetical protein
MKPSLGVSLRSEKFGGEFKNSRYYVCSFALLLNQLYQCVLLTSKHTRVLQWNIGMFSLLRSYWDDLWLGDLFIDCHAFQFV